MPLYKFYRIVPKDVSKTDCYIGHTTQPLRKRFSQHWNARNRIGSGSCSSAMLFHNYGRDALEIVLIHELELPDKEFARREERRLYEEYRERVVNKNRPSISKDEMRDDANMRMKKYSDTHNEALKAMKRRWYHDNKEQAKAILAKTRNFYAGLKYFARISIE